MGGELTTLSNTVYKPVLFRHGGYDNFTNSKVVECTTEDSSGNKVTQNLAQEIAFSNNKYVTEASRWFQDTGYQAKLGDPYSNWSVVNWITPYQSDNSTIRHNNTGPVGAAYYSGSNRFIFDNNVYIGGQYSRLQIRFGWYGLGSSSGSVPGYFSTNYAYPYGSSAGNAQALQHESYMSACTCSHDSSTGVTTAKLYLYNAIGTQLLNYTYTFTPTSAMPTISNYFMRTDETVAYDTALNSSEIEAHFKNHPTLKQIDPSNTSSITYTNTPVIAPVDPTTLSTWSNAIIYLRGGDAPGDSSTAMENVAGANTHFPASLPIDSGSTTYTDIGSSKGAHLTSNDSQNVFSINSNLSISGWFKTTGSGTLFSNSSNGSNGLRCSLDTSNITISTGNQNNVFSHGGSLTDGDWHHIVLTKPTTGSPVCKLYLDGVEHSSGSFTLSNIDDSFLRGNQGFTLLGDGVENINKANPAATDSSKLQATISNWSLHTEILDAIAVKQLYSNGHVRNIKNLPSVSASAIECWWQLNSTTNGGLDLINGKNLKIVDASNVATLNSKAVQASTLTSGVNAATRDFILNGNKNPWGDNNDMPDMDAALSMSFWLNIPSSGSTWDVMFGFSATDTRNHFKLHNIGNNLSFSFCAGGVGSDYSIDYSGKFNAWHHIVMVKQASTNLGLLEIFVNGVRQTITQTYPSSGADPSASGWDNQTVSEFYLFGNGRRFDVNNAFGSNRTGRVFKLDEMAFYSKALSHNTSSAGDVATGEVGDIYNSGNYVDISTVSGVNLQKYFKFGDHSSDVTTTPYGKYYDSVNNAAFFQEQNPYTHSYSLLTTDSHYALAPSTVQGRQVDATGAAYVNGSINGNAITMSLTKSFNFTTNKWVTTSDQDAALCLSFNGFEEQAEYFAIWKCSQTVGGSAINILDGGWHNVILSYRGKNNLSGDNVDPGDTVKFGPGPANSLAFNWALSYDGQPLTSIKDGSGADYIGGLNTLVTDSYTSTTYNVGFAIQDRHLKYITTNSEEEYKPHAQFSAGIHEVSGVDNENAFQGSVDETSFHSDDWWVDQAGTSIITNTYNQEKPATIYGNTTALSNRQGANTDYPEGKPYDLLNPQVLLTSGNNRLQGLINILTLIAKTLLQIQMED